MGDVAGLFADITPPDSSPPVPVDSLFSDIKAPTIASVTAARGSPMKSQAPPPDKSSIGYRAGEYIGKIGNAASEGAGPQLQTDRSLGNFPEAEATLPQGVKDNPAAMAGIRTLASIPDAIIRGGGAAIEGVAHGAGPAFAPIDRLGRKLFPRIYPSEDIGTTLGGMAEWGVQRGDMPLGAHGPAPADVLTGIKAKLARSPTEPPPPPIESPVAPPAAPLAAVRPAETPAYLPDRNAAKSTVPAYLPDRNAQAVARVAPALEAGIADAMKPAPLAPAPTATPPVSSATAAEAVPPAKEAAKAAVQQRINALRQKTQDFRAKGPAPIVAPVVTDAAKPAAAVAEKAPVADLFADVKTAAAVEPVKAAEAPVIKPAPIAKEAIPFGTAKEAAPPAAAPVKASETKAAAVVDNKALPADEVENKVAETPVQKAEAAKIVASPAVQAEIATPRTIDRTHDVPGTAGSSKEGGVTYIDHNVPEALPVKTLDGKAITVDPAKYLNIHEQVEHALMVEGDMPFHEAHYDHATVAEHAALREDNIDPASYEKSLAPYKNRVWNEKPANPPKDLYETPYPHNEQNLLEAAGVAKDTKENVAAAPDEKAAPEKAAEPEPAKVAPEKTAPATEAAKPATKPLKGIRAEAARRVEAKKATEAPSSGPTVMDAEKAQALKPSAGQPAGTFMFDPRDLAVDAERFQFRSQTDDKGVNQTLRSVQNWRPERGNQIMVWQDKAGELFVADGHQRTGLARRLIESGKEKSISIPGVLFREKDGFAAEDVTAIAALKNIAEGSADPVDAAVVMRAIGPEALADMPLSKDAVKSAADLAKLSDDAWKMVTNGVVEPNHARFVGQIIDDPVKQVAAMKVLAKAEPANETEAGVLVRRVAGSDVSAAGGSQADMFGVSPESTVIEESKIVAGAIRALKSDKKLFARVLREADRIEKTGSVIERKAAGETATEADRAAAIIEAEAFRAGPIRETLKALAKEVKNEGLPLTEARNSLIEAFRSGENPLGASRAELRAQGEPVQGEIAQAGSPAEKRVASSSGNAASENAKESGPAGSRAGGEERLPAGEGRKVAGIEATAAGEQHVLQGAERISDRSLAERKAAAPLKGKVNQKLSMDEGGLFGDSHKQQTLLSTSGKEPGAKELEKAIAEHRPAILGPDGAMGEAHLRETTPSGEPVEKVIAAVHDIIRETVGPHVGIEFHDIIPTEGAATPEHLEAMQAAAQAGRRPLNRTAGGTARLPYRGEPATISVALQDPIYDPRTTGFHESWHVVEFVALNEKERAFIQSKDAMEAVDSWAAEELGMMPTEPEIQAMPAYERRAIAYQRYARMKAEGRPAVHGIPAALRAIWDRLTLMFKRIKVALADKGVGRIEDVFDVSRLGGYADRIGPDQVLNSDPAKVASTNPTGSIQQQMAQRAAARAAAASRPPTAATRPQASAPPSLPAPRPSGGLLGATNRGIRSLVSPATVDKTAGKMAGVIREKTGTYQRATDQARAAVEPDVRPTNKLTDRQQLAIQHEMERPGTVPASEFTPAMRDVADTLKDVFHDVRQRIEALPPLARQRFVTNYFTHIWENDAKEVRDVMSAAGYSLKGGSHLLPRQIPTIAQGIRLGLKPKYVNPIDAAVHYAGQMHNFLARVDVLHTGGKTGLMEWHAPGEQPDGWKKLNGDDLVQRSSLKPGPGGEYRVTHEALYAPESAARVYNNWVSEGFKNEALLGDTIPKVYDLARRFSNGVVALKLGLSGFHAFTVATSAVYSGVARGIGELRTGHPIRGLRMIAGAPAEPIRGVIAGKRLVNEWLRPGSSGDPLTAKLADLYAEAGGRAVGLTHENRVTAQGSFWMAAKRATLGKEIRAGLNDVKQNPLKIVPGILHNVGRILETVSYPLFNRYIPHLKAGAFADMMSSWLNRHPGATHEEALTQARQFADSVDNRFGEMVHDNLFQHNALKQGLGLAALSYTWTLGFLREGAGVGNLKQPHRLDAVTGFALTTAAIGSLYQFMKTGEQPTDVRDVVAPKTGGKNPDGSDERAILPGHSKDVIGFWNNGLFGELGNKINPAWPLAAQMLSPLKQSGGADWRGDPFFDPKKSPLDNPPKGTPGWLIGYLNAIKDAYSPITAQTLGKSNGPKSNLSTAERLMSIRQAPFAVSNPSGYAAYKARLDKAAQTRAAGRKP